MYTYISIIVLGFIWIIRLIYFFQCHLKNFNYDTNDQIPKVNYYHMELKKKKMGLRKRVCSQLLKNHDTLSGIFFIKEHVTWYLYQILGSIYLKGTMKVHLNTEDIYVNEKCYFKNLLDYWDYFSSWGIRWIPENFVGNRWLTATRKNLKWHDFCNFGAL